MKLFTLTLFCPIVVWCTSPTFPLCKTSLLVINCRGPFVLALGKSWCPDHFVCSHSKCRRKLLDVGFIEENDQIYCEYCFEQYFAPNCAKCFKSVTGVRKATCFLHVRSPDRKLFCCNAAYNPMDPSSKATVWNLVTDLWDEELLFWAKMLILKKLPDMLK